VTADFFTVAGATSVSNDAGSGVVTAVFPVTQTSTVICIAAIPGVTPPVLGEIPMTTITETAQCTGTVAWDGGWAWSPRFGGQKVYTATITLTVKLGYTLMGVAANFFTVAGATSSTNNANSGVITAVFPTTASVTIGDAVLGGKVAYIFVSSAFEQRGLIAATSDQSTGIIWAVSSCQEIDVPGSTATDFGTGSANTDKIIAQNGASTGYAAGLARAYNGGGYTDWYLPSKDELEQLYRNKDAIGGFSPHSYASSSEYAYLAAWFRLFSDTWFYAYKAYSSSVRAVRNF
jgi:hypothetical protein